MSKNNALRERLDRDDGEYPESWIPEPGDVLVGPVVNYDSGHTAYGEVPTVIIEDEEAGVRRSVWLIHAVLRSEFKKQRPKPGERVGIKRLPDDPQKKYKRYSLVVDRDEPDVPDFDSFDPAGDVPEGELDTVRAPTGDVVDISARRPNEESPLHEPSDDLPF